MSRAGKDKGARAERELASIFKEHGIAAKRGFVWLKQSDVVGLPGIHVECKFVEKLNYLEALEQAVRESEKRNDGAPAVFSKKSRKGWSVTMRLDDWLSLYFYALKGGFNDDAENKNFTALNDEEGNHERGGV